MRSNRGIGYIAVTLAGLAMGILIGWVIGQAVGARIQVVEGDAWVNEAGTAIGLSSDGEAPGTGYVVAGAMWREQDGPWHDSLPACLKPLVAGQSVRLGVLRARPHGGAPGRSIVVWLECLD